MQLADVHQAIQSFRAQSLPVIDAAQADTSCEVLPGLRLLRNEVKRDCELLRQHGNSPALSTNAPYLVAVWDELVHAHNPVAIYRMFSPDKERKEKALTVKVDIVAENGARWIRVNTIKNARLMMEFREIDSYLTSDDEDKTRPRLTQPEFDNSVLRMGRELLAAAKVNPISLPIPFPSTATTMTPQVTICLTRLAPLKDDTPDRRVEKTIRCLREMGIDVQLGERSDPRSVPISKAPTMPKLLQPSTNINLDLSALIALISDISHSPLPRTEQEAHARFEPPQSYLDWKKGRIKSLARRNQGTHDNPEDSAEGGEDTYENSGQHSRALAAQVIQEMSKGILQEIREHIAGQPSMSVVFWTTSEARHRCVQIVSKIGGEREKLRADALLGSILCARTPSPDLALAQTWPNGVDIEGKAPGDAYWEHSRYPAGFIPLVPVHVYPSILPEVVEVEDRQSTFFGALAQTCVGILSREAVPMSHVLTPSPSPTTEQVLEEIPPASQTSLPKLTVHTVTSMLAGSSRGHTTLTTNRSSVKVILKEVRRVCGRGGYGPRFGVEGEERAALWILGPRSLSEGMRSQ